jgi:hypothetical protein
MLIVSIPLPAKNNNQEKINSYNIQLLFIYPDMDVTSCRNTTGQHVDLIIYIKHFHIDYIIILQQIYIFKFISHIE